MDFNATLDIIINDLKEAREIIDDLKNYPGISLLQIELAKSKCKNAEEIISLLKTFPPTVETVTSAGIDHDTNKDPASGKQQEPLTLKEMEKQSDPGKEIITEVRSENKEQEKLIVNEVNHSPETSQPELFEIDEEKTSGTVPEPERRIKEKKPDKPIIADKFSKVSNIVDEQLGTHKRDDDISSVLKTKPVGNLKDAIGLNDKFLYIRELFDGNQRLYEEAMTKLNNSGSLDEARSVLTSYVGNDEENELVEQLLDLVKRKLKSDG
jgi:hypothetical protein